MTVNRVLRGTTTTLFVAGALALGACSTSSTSTSSSSAPSSSTTSSSAAPATTGTVVPPDRSGSAGPATDDTTSGEATAAACRLVTRADAEAAFGEPAVAGTQSSDECWWSTANDLKTINVIIREPDLDSWRQGHANDTWESVSGLGEEAFASKALDSVELRVGNTVYEINVVYSTKGDPKAVVQQLSETVASRV